MNPLRTLRAAGLLAAAALALSACGGGASPSMTDGATATPSGTPAAAAYPVTLSHAFGTTTIPAAPSRVVTWGWGSADAAIALGVVPVAIPAQSYGGDADGVLPWIREALEKTGTPVPTVLPDATEAPVEAIAAAKPDVILAPYSGITEAEYQQLSKIAPTVAYPETAWATPWKDTIRIVGTALGKSAEADALLASIDAAVAAEAADHPELAGKSVAMVWPTADAFYVYKPADARVAFTLDLGLTSATSVDQLASGDETFYYTLSTEQLDRLSSDILVSYASTEQEAADFLASPEAKLMDQVAGGRVASVVGTELIAAVSPPTALSLTWGLDAYVAALSKAAS